MITTPVVLYKQYLTAIYYTVPHTMQSTIYAVKVKMRYCSRTFNAT